MEYALLHTIIFDLDNSICTSNIRIAILSNRLFISMMCGVVCDITIFD